MRNLGLRVAVLLALVAALGCGSRRAVSPTTEPDDGGRPSIGDEHVVDRDGQAVQPRDTASYEGPCPATCGGYCTDTNTDTNNCGACGARCAAGGSCQGGACTCPAKLTDCGGTCVDLTSDQASCGSCGNACGPGQPCLNGVCGGVSLPCPSKQWQGNIYFFCQAALPWADASAACTAAGTHLVTINDDAENTWLYNEVVNKGTNWWWTGFNDLQTEGQWTWEDGAPVTYTNWGTGEPNNVNGGEDCGNTGQYQPYEWNDETCSTPASYVCESLAGVPGKWVVVPAGTFVMGASLNEVCRESCHGKETQHTVALTHDFEISSTEVTQGEFLTLMGFNPAPPSSCGPTCPAESVSWHQAAAYCNALSSKAGLASCYSCSGSGPLVTCTEAAAYSGGKIYSCPGYRLPTDAEWEYAYRAGSTTALYPTAGNNGMLTSCGGFDPNADMVGWNSNNSGGVPHPVGTKPPNAWGLYGMAGNAHEWCHDRYSADLGSSMTTDPWGGAVGSNRVLRSGSWYCPANEARAACRFEIGPTGQNIEFGFRPCRTLLP